VQFRVLFPPLEQAPDQIASRPFETLRVMDVPFPNDADPDVPTITLMPAGLDVIRSPLRPLAVTVSVAACEGGFTVSVVVRVTRGRRKRGEGSRHQQRCGARPVSG
jgi:hypothetical protein